MKTLIVACVVAALALLANAAMKKSSLECFGEGWASMDTAPRDGTVVELCATYGAEPWYGLHRWTREVKAFPSGSVIPVLRPGQSGVVIYTFGGGPVPETYELDEPAWVMEEEGLKVDEEEFLHWRPAKEVSHV